jgi:hypothetical protein
MAAKQDRYMKESEWRTWIRSKVQAASPLLWIIETNLACSPRPLRYHATFGGRRPLIPLEAAPILREWVDSVRDCGMGTIVVLATAGEIRRYSSVALPNPDLLALYRSVGFVVHHHPVEDPAHSPASAKAGIMEQMELIKPMILEEYQARTGGMLIHCSGGMDRTAPVAAYVARSSEHAAS